MSPNFTPEQLLQLYSEMSPEDRRQFMKKPQNAEAFLEWNELKALLDRSLQKPRKQTVDAILAYAEKGVTA